MGMCANGSVPAACGLTGGRGRAEPALGPFGRVPFPPIWREISRRLAVARALFFLACGRLAALLLV